MTTAYVNFRSPEKANHLQGLWGSPTPYCMGFSVKALKGHTQHMNEKETPDRNKIIVNNMNNNTNDIAVVRIIMSSSTPLSPQQSFDFSAGPEGQLLVRVCCLHRLLYKNGIHYLTAMTMLMMMIMMQMTRMICQSL